MRISTSFRSSLGSYLAYGIVALLLTFAGAPAAFATDHSSDRSGVEPRFGYPPSLVTQSSGDAQAPGLLARIRRKFFPFGLSLFNWDASNGAEPLASAVCYEGNCAGGSSLADDMAAAHASRNLGIPYDSLKAKMSQGKTLKQAIQELRPGVNPSAAARKAEDQARQQLKDAQS